MNETSEPRRRSFTPMPEGLMRDPRYRALSHPAAGLLFLSHSISDDLETHGVIDPDMLDQLRREERGETAAEVEATVAELVKVGFFQPLGDGRYRIDGFIDLPPFMTEEEEERVLTENDERRWEARGEA